MSIRTRFHKELVRYDTVCTLSGVMARAGSVGACLVLIKQLQLPAEKLYSHVSRDYLLGKHVVVTG